MTYSVLKTTLHTFKHSCHKEFHDGNYVYRLLFQRTLPILLQSTSAFDEAPLLRHAWLKTPSWLPTYKRRWLCKIACRHRPILLLLYILYLQIVIHRPFQRFDDRPKFLTSQFVLFLPPIQYAQLLFSWWLGLSLPASCQHFRINIIWKHQWTPTNCVPYIHYWLKRNNL